MPLISATNLHKTYRLGKTDVPVLRGVDLAVDRGEWLAVLGSSGSGKSTLLHLLGGLDRPDTPGKTGGQRSSIIFDGAERADMSRRQLDRFRATDVGFVFQFYHLLPELRVIDNVCVAAMTRLGRLGYRGDAKAQTEARAKELLDAFGLGSRLHHKPAELSGGERQRVAIARALINRPRLLLADEPTGNLDRTTGAEIIASLESLRERLGLTVVMVTHDEHIAQRADRVVRLADGVLAGDQPTKTDAA